RKSTQSSGDHSPPVASECEHMVVHQALKCVDTLNPGGIDEAHTRRGRGHQSSVAANRDVRDLIGDQSVGLGQNLLPARGGVENHPTVSRRDSGHPAIRMMNDAVDAEKVIVLKLRDPLPGGTQDLETPVKV